jgi:Zn-dependent peptidase ImmA (M78 family)/DNA-binding XRE family transcriptional regulator
MLKWARDEVGYTIEQAAEAIGISAESLLAAEKGKPPLTLNQLQMAAEKYSCPFGYFYLSKPPHGKSYQPIPDFRIEPGFIGVSHHKLNLELKRVRDRRLLYMELAKDLELELKGFKVLTATEKRGKSGILIRNRLGIKDSDLASLKNYEKVYPYWKSKIENDGVLVYESQYIPDVSGVIGAAIYYDVCPIILIKRGSKYNARRLFTLVHEYAHLLHGESAINDASSQTVRAGTADKSRLEAACNGLAAEILIPSDKFSPAHYSSLNPVQKMERLAGSFKVTYTTAAVFLKRNDLISDEEFSELLKLRQEAYARSKKSDRKVIIPREILMRLDLGRPMFSAVLKAYTAGALDVFDASKLLNLRVHKIDKLLAGSPE